MTKPRRSSFFISPLLRMLKLYTTCTLTSMKKRLTLEVGWLYMYTEMPAAATKISTAMEMPARSPTGCCSALPPTVSSSAAAQTQ